VHRPLNQYADLLAWLFVARRAGVDFDLSRVRNCLLRLGNPQDGFRVRVHIAGTNGKGSTATFTEAMVRSAGIRTGVFTSPHLSRFCERFAIDGEPASEAAILEAGRTLAAAMVEGEPLTFFERTTVIAILVFASAQVEACILEVGLGGRLDATNVIAAEVAAVTTIARDHESFLGDQLEQIAREKAGIFKVGQRVVISSANRDDIAALLVRVAREQGAVRVEESASVDWPLGMLGDHQRHNAGCALGIIDHLEALGVLRLSEDARRQALANARMAGRFEKVADSPTIIVDGAHNPNAAQTLVNALDEHYPDAKLTLIIAVSAGKDSRTIVTTLAGRADQVIATRYGQERSLDASEIAEQARAVTQTVIEPDIERAVSHARDLAGPEDVIVIAGSLFLVGEARQLLVGAAADPQVVQDPM